MPEAIELSDLSLKDDSLRRASRTWLFRGYYLKDLYKALFRDGGVEGDSVRYGAINAYMTAKKLDTADEFKMDILMSSNFLASTIFNDAAVLLDQGDFVKAKERYAYYKQFSKLINPDFDAAPRDIEYNLYEASKRSSQLEKLTMKYDTNEAKIIDSLYVAVLKLDPVNVSAQNNLKTHRINDGKRRQTFLADLEKENELTKAESAARRSQTLALGGGLLVMILLAGMSYRAYNQKKKANTLIAEQKQEVEI